MRERALGDGGTPLLSADARADELTEQLMLAGFTSHKKYELGDYVVVEAEVVRPLSADAWRELYELLATVSAWGGKWGLVSKRHGLTAHASIKKTSPTRLGRPGA